MHIVTVVPLCVLYGRAVYGPLGDKMIGWQTVGWWDIWAKDVFATQAGQLVDIIGRQGINIIYTIIQQVTCKAKVDII